MRLADCDYFRVPVGPGAMHVERYGYGGPSVVLLHGFGTNAFLWRRIAPELAVSQHAVFAFDLFGYGASDRPFDADFGIGAQAIYVRRAIRALKLQSPTLVGCDIAALVAMRLAFDNPGDVSRLVLVSPADLADLPGPHIRLMQRETARHVLRLVRGLFGAEPLIRRLLESSLAETSSLPPRLVGRFVAPYLGRDGVNHLLALARALDHEELADLAPGKIYSPTVLVRGSEDRWCTKAYAESLASRLPDARLETVRATGRLVAEEDPNALIRLIEATVALESVPL
jgi:pimeloyl-ACP methyl ester carboxylesterase